MKVNASITDFPLFSMQETFFKRFRESGIDGLELVLGIKSRFEYARVTYLSEKYDLPIETIHQPMWSGLGLYFDESFVAFAKKLNVANIVFHPLPLYRFDSKKMKKYFQKIAFLQEKYNICALIENMSMHDIFYEKLFDDSKQSLLHHFETVNEIADTYGFLLTFDVSHAELINPGKNDIFTTIYPKVGNIHLSSFSKKPHRHHLPLNEGDLELESFLSYLTTHLYKGKITLEINDSMLRRIVTPYNFKAVMDSAQIVKRILNKLS